MKDMHKAPAEIPHMSLKPLSPSGDLGVRDDAPMKKAFPRPIKNAGKELVSSQALKYRPFAKAGGDNS